MEFPENLFPFFSNSTFLAPHLYVEDRLTDRHLTDNFGLQLIGLSYTVCADPTSVGQMVFDHMTSHHTFKATQLNNLKSLAFKQGILKGEVSLYH
jgi:hypothetical protein